MAVTNLNNQLRKVLESSLRTKFMENQDTKFGFTQFAETWNGRLAMFGFAIGLATELLTGKGILSQLGLM
jgi:hypothetical protein